MTSNGLLAAPLKKTSEVEMTKAMTKYAHANFKKSPIVDNAIQELHRLRNCAVVQTLDKNETSLAILTRYYDQLAATQNKLPMTATQISIPFKWKDAFDKGSLLGKSRALQILTVESGSFEKAAVLFNVGAMMSQIGAIQNLSADDELKGAAKLLQQSAGVFGHLKDVVLSLVQQEPTPDLLPDTLNALQALMLAQAQEAIYLKANKDNMKPGLLAKVAAQTSDFYVDALTKMTNEKVKAQWDKEWLANVNGKILVYRGMAEYHQSRQNCDNKEIGEELGRLEEAVGLWKQAQGHLATAGIANALKDDHARVHKAYETAKKDNDFIYHEKIPPFDSLFPIGRAALAKPLPVSSPLSANFQDLFECLEPKDNTSLLGKLKKAVIG